MPSLLKIKKERKRRKKIQPPFLPPPTQVHPEGVQTPVVVQAGGCSVCVYTHFTRAVLFPACLLTLMLGGRTDRGRRMALETLVWERKKTHKTTNNLRKAQTHALCFYNDPCATFTGTLPSAGPLLYWERSSGSYPP